MYVINSISLVARWVLCCKFHEALYWEVSVDDVLSHTLRSATHHFMKKLRLSCDTTSVSKMEKYRNCKNNIQNSRQDSALTNCEDLLQKSRLSRQTFRRHMRLEIKHRHRKHWLVSHSENSLDLITVIRKAWDTDIISSTMASRKPKRGTSWRARCVETSKILSKY